MTTLPLWRTAAEGRLKNKPWGLTQPQHITSLMLFTLTKNTNLELAHLQMICQSPDGVAYVNNINPSKLIGNRNCGLSGYSSVHG
jgi:hypothetical protein